MTRETFRATILNPKEVLFEGETWSVFLCGVEGEFEILKFHKDIVSLLKEGIIIVNWKKKIPIKKGVVKVFNGELTALVE